MGQDQQQLQQEKEGGEDGRRSNRRKRAVRMREGAGGGKDDTIKPSVPRQNKAEARAWQESGLVERCADHASPHT